MDSTQETIATIAEHQTAYESKSKVVYMLGMESICQKVSTLRKKSLLVSITKVAW